MADKNTIEQMLEHLVNGDQAKAEELFHEYVVEASREIYESMIESEMSDEEDDEEVDEAAEDEDAEEDKVEENFDEFEDLTIEADDEEGADPTDDLLGDVEMDDEEGEMDGEEGEEDLESKVMDLEDAVEELEAKFAELAGEEAGEEEGEMGGMDDMGSDEGEEDEMKDSFDQELATMREYVEKVAGGHGAEKKGAGEKGADTKSPVAGKNDMGGTTANIAKGGEGGGSDKGLLSPKTKEDNAGNINTPGAKNGNAFSTKEPGHGAEKKGAAEQADNKQSLFRK
jgi:hypothetical protein